MDISAELQHQIADTLIDFLHGKYDGTHKNIVSECPFCHHAGDKFGVYVGRTTKYKQFGACNCFHCQRRSSTLRGTLEMLGLEELLPKETTDLDDDDLTKELNLFDDDDVDDSLKTITMPEGYKRCFRNSYLKSRHFNADDYGYFPCGTTRGLNYKYDDYVLLEIRDGGKLVGYVGRHTWSKKGIDDYNDTHHYKIRRYNNSTENEFSKLLYNIDAVEQYETDTVILCEGCFDTIALTRKLELYDYHQIVPVATFGKKISDIQIYKLQQKGIKQVVLGYDADAKDTTGHIAMQLDQYFDVYVADLSNADGKDWDEMSTDCIYDIFSNNIVTVREFNLE